MTKISALSSATPGTTSLLVAVVNSTTVQVTAAQVANLSTIAGMSSLASGAIFYGNSSGQAAALAIGTSGYILQSTGGVPAWVANPNELPATPSSGAVLVYSTAATSGAAWSKPTSGAVMTGSSLGVPTWSTTLKVDSSSVIVDAGLTAIDTAAWNSGLVNFGRNLTLIGGTTDGDANQAIVNVHGYITEASAAPAAYEKMGIFSRVRQNVASDTSSTAVYRDAVGIKSHGEVNSNVTRGRVWGGHFVAGSLASAVGEVAGDGYMVAGEFELNHYGTSQADVDQTTSKYGVHIVALQGEGTAAINLNSSSPYFWHKGLYANASAIGTGADDSFIEWPTKFIVDSSGYVGAGTTAPVNQLSVFSTKTVAKIDISTTTANSATYLLLDHTFNWSGIDDRLSGVPNWFIGGQGASTATFNVYVSSAYTLRMTLSSIALFASSAIAINVLGTPTSAAVGQLGQIQVDASFLYVHTSTSPHVWKRAALSSF